MKKVLSIILVIAMLPVLCSCGPEVIEKSPFTVQIKGDGSKAVKLNIADTLTEEYERTISTDDSAVSPGGSEEAISVSCTTTEKDHSVTYKFSGNGPGAIGVHVDYKSGNKMIAVVGFTLNVDENSKIYCTNVSIQKDDPYEAPQEDKEYVLTEYEGGTRSIKLVGGNGIWEVGSFDTLVEILDETYDEENTVITMAAKRVGEGHVQLLNRTMKKDFDVNVAVSEVTDENGKTSLLLTIADVVEQEYTAENDQHLIAARNEYLESAKALDPEIVLPESSYIKEFNAYNSKDEKLVEEDEQNVENIDTIESQFVFEGSEFSYEISSSMKYDEKIKSYDEEKTATNEDVSINGRLIHYIFVEVQDKMGYAVAIWQDGDNTCVLTNMTGGTDAECLKLFNSFFSEL